MGRFRHVSWMALWLAIASLGAPAPAVADPGASRDGPSDAATAPEIEDPSGPPPSPLRLFLDQLAPLDDWEADGFDARLRALRSSASELGYFGHDAAGVALWLRARGDDSGRFATAARQIAPDLPAARMADAWSRLRSGESVFDALADVGRAVLSLDRHFEASLWLRSTLSLAISMALFGGSLFFLLVATAAAVRSAWRPREGGVPTLPRFSRLAILASLGLVPFLVGEGAFGLIVAALFLCASQAVGRERLALAMAAAALFAALHPGIDATARHVTALGADPLIDAVRRVERGVPTGLEIERLEQAAPVDPLAAHALAIWHKRTGQPAEASRLLERLGAEASGDVVLLNNLANLRLASGRTEEAVSLYELAAGSELTATVLFNLAQAHGEAIDLGEQEAALGLAQGVDSVRLRDLEAIRADARRPVIDLAFPAWQLRQRALASAPWRGLAAAMREPLAPGRAGGRPLAAAFALAGAVGLGMLVAARKPGDGGLALASAPAPRSRWSWLAGGMPGWASLAAGRPVFALVNLWSRGTAIAVFGVREGIVVDPLAAGAAGGVALAGVAAVGLVVACVGYAMGTRDRARSR